MEHLQLVVKSIRQETSESKTFVVERVDGKSINYKAGQFITLLVNLGGKEVRRSYSISSTPGVDAEVFFTIKRIENGELSRYLFDELALGDVITALPPTGRFVIDKPESNLLVFISAGSGITPVYSLIKHVLFSFAEAKVLLIYQSRNEKEAIFRDEILRLQQQFSARFTLKEIFSEPINYQLSPQRLNNNLLEKILINSLKSASVTFYLCGPGAFMRMAEFTLKVMHFEKNLIKREDFFAVAPPPPFMTDLSAHTVTLHYHQQTHQLEVAYPHNILEIALKHNIQLPFSCRGGRCSTCTAKCTKGRVKMTINDVLTPHDLEHGLILTCVSYPETDVELTFDVVLPNENES
jgi:ring-1,2-phenylacetyl-CoA epoxidase subunit PaaE